MKFTGTTEVSLTAVTLTHLSGIENRCAECNRVIAQEEKIIVFAEGKVEENVVSLDPAIYFIHVKGKEKGSCLEDFIARFLQNINPEPKIPSIEQPQVEVAVQPQPDQPQ